MKTIKYLCLLTTAALSLLMAACGNDSAAWYRTDETSLEEESSYESSDASEKDDGAEDLSVEEFSRAESASIYVYICGQVVSPGVYELPEGSRIYQAIDLAGGLTKEADTRRINQAAVMTDGQQIIIYAVGEEASEAESGTETSNASGLININTAGKEELMTLSGIGEAKASAIVAWRNENGPFSGTEDIIKVSGIGESLYGKIRDKITV